MSAVSRIATNKTIQFGDHAERGHDVRGPYDLPSGLGRVNLSAERTPAGVEYSTVAYLNGLCLYCGCKVTLTRSNSATYLYNRRFISSGP